MNELYTDNLTPATGVSYARRKGRTMAENQAESAAAQSSSHEQEIASHLNEVAKHIQKQADERIAQAKQEEQEKKDAKEKKEKDEAKGKDKAEGADVHAQANNTPSQEAKTRMTQEKSSLKALAASLFSGSTADESLLTKAEKFDQALAKSASAKDLFALRTQWEVPKKPQGMTMGELLLRQNACDLIDAAAGKLDTTEKQQFSKLLADEQALTEHVKEFQEYLGIDGEAKKEEDEGDKAEKGEGKDHAPDELRADEQATIGQQAAAAPTREDQLISVDNTAAPSAADKTQQTDTITVQPPQAPDEQQKKAQVSAIPPASGTDKGEDIVTATFVKSGVLPRQEIDTLEEMVPAGKPEPAKEAEDTVLAVEVAPGKELKITDTGELKPEVIENSRIENDDERLAKAADVLKVKLDELSDKQKEAILQAHNVGTGQKGKDKVHDAGVGNYTVAQLREKYQLLHAKDETGEELFQPDEIRELMEAGIVGKGGKGKGKASSITLEELGWGDDPYTLLIRDTENEREAFKAYVASAGDAELQNIFAEIPDPSDTKAEFERKLQNLYGGLVFNFIQRSSERFRNDPAAAHRLEQKQMADYIQQLHQIRDEYDPRDIDKTKERLQNDADLLADKILNGLNKLKEATSEGRERLRTIDSIEDAAEAIMQEDEATWGNRDALLKRGLTDVVKAGFGELNAGVINDMLDEIQDKDSLTEGDIANLLKKLGEFKDSAKEEEERFLKNKFNDLSQSEKESYAIADVVVNPETGEKRPIGERGNLQIFQQRLENIIHEYEGIPTLSGAEHDQLMKRLIALREPERLKYEGRFALLTKEGQMNKVNEDNFVKWVESRIKHYHEENPNDPEVQFGNRIAIERNDMYRAVSVGMMIDNTKLYFKSRRPGVNTYTDLRDRVYNRIWLVGNSRNMDVYYRKVMPMDSKLPEIMQQLFEQNAFIKTAAGSGLNTMQEVMTWNNGAVRSAYLVYYNFLDYGKLQEIYGPQFDLFTKNGMEEAVLALVNKDNYAGLKSTDEQERQAARKLAIKDFFTRLDRETGGKYSKANIVDENGNLNTDLYVPDPTDTEPDPAKKRMILKDKKTANDYLTLLNPFNPPNRTRDEINLTRELIKYAVGQRAGLQDDETGRDFSEMMAYLMTYWSGAAARGDKSAAAFNAMTKPGRLMQYLMKAADRSRAGGAGTPYEASLMYKYMLDPMTGMLTADSQMPIDYIEKMEKAQYKPQDVDYQHIPGLSTQELNLLQEFTHNGQLYIDSERLTSKQRKMLESIATKAGNGLRFDDNSMRQSVSNHVVNAFKRFQDITAGKEARIDAFVKYDPLSGSVVVDNAKMIAEIQEGIIKPTRYSLDTHKLNYAAFVRADMSSNFAGQEYETVTVAEDIFTPQVLRAAERIYKKEMIEDMERKEADALKKVREAKTPAEREKAEEQLEKIENENKKNRKLVEKGFMTPDGRIKRYEKDIEENGVIIHKKGDLTEESLYALIKSEQFARIATKASLVCKFAAQIYAHTDPNSPYEKFNFVTKEHIFEGFARINASMELNDQDFTKARLTGFYFTEFDIELMRELSHNKYYPNFFKALRKEAGRGAFAGLKDSLKKFFKFIAS